MSVCVCVKMQCVGVHFYSCIIFIYFLLCMFGCVLDIFVKVFACRWLKFCIRACIWVPLLFLHHCYYLINITFFHHVHPHNTIYHLYYLLYHDNYHLPVEYITLALISLSCLIRTSLSANHSFHTRDKRRKRTKGN